MSRVQGVYGEEMDFIINLTEKEVNQLRKVKKLGAQRVIKKIVDKFDKIKRARSQR